MQPSLLPSLLLCLVTLLVVAGILRAIAAALPRTALPPASQLRLRNSVYAFSVGWIVLVSVLALLGIFKVAGLPPRPIIAMNIGVVFLVLASFRRRGKALLIAVPLHSLIYLQAFRIAVELVLWLGHRRGVIPQAMTFEGSNWDILVGLAAFPAGYIMQRQGRKAHFLHIVFNVFGLLSLINILLTAMKNMPGEVSPGELSMAVVGNFPFIYLPTVLVLIAVAGHILSMRQLALTRPPLLPPTPFKREGQLDTKAARGNTV